MSDHCFASSILGSEAVFSGRTGSSVTSSIEHLHAIVTLVSSAIVRQTRPAAMPTVNPARKLRSARRCRQPSDSQKSQLSSHSNATPVKTVSVPVEQATIGRSLVIKGEVSGTESLYIDGAVNFAGHRVTVGSNGSAAANISAREVVIIGEVQGNIQCTDRLDIRSQGSLTGDVITHRISVEDGAFLKGGVQIRAVEQKTDKSQQAKAKQASAEPAKPATTEKPKAAAAVAGT